jgi:hypothetical protein
MLVCINGWESAALHVARVARLELPGQIAILALHQLIYSVRLGQVLLLAGDDVSMHVGHALTGILAVLDRDVQRRGLEDALNGARHALHGQEEVLDLGGGQVMEARNDAAWRDEDVARKQRLEVHEGVRQRGKVEDLSVGCRQPRANEGVRDMATSRCVWAGRRTWLVTTKAPNLITSEVSGGMPTMGCEQQRQGRWRLAGDRCRAAGLRFPGRWRREQARREGQRRRDAAAQRPRAQVQVQAR